MQNDKHDSMKYAILIVLIGGLTACKTKSPQMAMPDFNDALAQRIRETATAIPGEMPVRINYVKYAESIRKWKDLIDDGSDDAATMARTAFQIEYPQGFIMVDAGMDRQVHHFFEKESPQPFNDSAASLVARAVQQAKLILITHEHGDHVANVVRLGNSSIPGKTILTREQAAALMNDPQMPEIKLDEGKSKQFLITDFESVLPVAPGVVLIKSPGHTNGEIMVYTKLQDGREFIFTGDVSWTYKGVEQNKQKPKSERKRVGENSDNVAKQLAWLNNRLVKDKMTILVSHDDIMLPQFAAQGRIGSTLILK